MPRKHGLSRAQQLTQAIGIYVGAEFGIADAELGMLLRVSRSTAYSYRLELSKQYNIYEVTSGRYTMKPTDGMIMFAHVVLRRERFEKSQSQKLKR